MKKGQLAAVPERESATAQRVVVSASDEAPGVSVPPRAAQLEQAAVEQASTKPSNPASGETSYLESFSAADVERAAARSGGGAAPLTWRIRPWSARADTLLALSFVELDADDTTMNIGQLRPEVAVLEKRGTELQRVAAAVVPIDTDSCVCDQGSGCVEAPKIDFDPARYRVAPEREAFGVRLTCHWTAPAAEGDSTRLTLFEPEAGQLRELLSTEVSSDTSDRVCGCTFSAQTTVQILSSQHAGFYDLRLHTRHQKAPFFDDVPLSEPAPKPSRQRLTWNGTRYTRE